MDSWTESRFRLHHSVNLTRKAPPQLPAVSETRLLLTHNRFRRPEDSSACFSESEGARTVLALQKHPDAQGLKVKLVPAVMDAEGRMGKSVFSVFCQSNR